MTKLLKFFGRYFPDTLSLLIPCESGILISNVFLPGFRIKAPFLSSSDQGCLPCSALFPPPVQWINLPCEYIPIFWKLPTDARMVAGPPQIGVGPGFDSQGSVNFLPNTAFPTYSESMTKLLRFKIEVQACSSSSLKITNRGGEGGGYLCWNGLKQTFDCPI